MASFEFIECDGSNKPTLPRRKVVRSHAARNVAARRERVEQYQRQRQEQKQRQSDFHRDRQRDLSHAADETLVDRGEWSVSWVPKMDTATGLSQRHPEPLDILGAARIDPYQSFSRRMSPMDHFLLDHFANCMVWCAIERYVTCTVQEQILWCTRMASHWVQMAADDPGILDAILSAACRHIDVQSGTETYDKLALFYQAQVVANLRESLEAEADAPSAATIVKTMCLATEAATLCNTSLAMKHTAAALRMYQLQDSKTGSTTTAATTVPPLPTGDAALDIDYAQPNHFQDRKELISLYDLKSTELRHRKVKWRNARLDEGCFIYTQFMLSRISLT